MPAPDLGIVPAGTRVRVRTVPGILARVTDTLARPPLPPPHASRPLTMADAHAAYELYAAAELADAGAVAVEPADLVATWQMPSVDLAADAVGVTDAVGRLVGAAEVVLGTRAKAAVHPDHRGRGLGTWLAAWCEDRARAAAGGLVGQHVPAGSGGERLLELPRDAPLSARLPEGCAVRTAASQEDVRAAHRVIADAFAEWSDLPRDFEDWAARTVRRPGTEPWQLRLAVDGAGEPVGACFVVLDGQGTGYVQQVGVRRDRRGRGLGAALLADAFGRARARGATRCELSTDSRTGALGLYEHLGMVVTQTWVHVQLPLVR
jgi:GNAT superfamily N-acetyltransferase